MNRKGFSVLGLIIFAVVAVIALIIVAFIFKHGDGNWNDGTMSATEAMATLDSDVQQVEYIKVTVKGNDYIYNDDVIELETIKKVLDEHESLSSVMIIDDEASEKAYRDLEDYLKENNIQIVKSEDESKWQCKTN